MYDRVLDTFIRAAELGSFSKVAEECYISASAVIQQINRLEDDMGVKLFERTRKGVELTEAGKYLYAESKALIHQCGRIKKELSAFSDDVSVPVIVSTNLFHMARILYECWPSFSSLYPGNVLSTYSFNDSGSDIRKDTDLIEGVYFDEPVWQKNFNFEHIRDINLSVMVPDSDRLAVKNIVTLDDLKDRTVVNLTRNVSEASDRFYDYLEEHGIEVTPEVIYSASAIIEHMAKHNPVIIPECWINMHPHTKIVPFEKDFPMPYGFFISRSATSSARKFIEFVKNMNK